MQLTRYNQPIHLQNGRHTTPASFFDELFDDFFGPTLRPAIMSTARTGRQNLQVDIYEKENVITIEAEIPGVAKDDIKIDVKGRQLTLGGERKRVVDTENGQTFRRERSFGTFERSFNLPFEIDTEKVKATLTDGVLRLEIEKPEKQQKKQITIN